MGQIRDIAADVKKIDTIEVNVTQLQSTQPTAVSQLTNDSGYQTLTQVNNAISALVNSAPSTLNTLNELAAALGNDANFATTVTTSLAGKVNKAGDTIVGDLNLVRSAAGSVVQSLLIKNTAPFGNVGQGVQLSMGNDVGSSHASPSGWIKTFTNNGASGASVMIFGGYSGSSLQENMFIEPGGQIRKPNQPVFSATTTANIFTPGNDTYVYGTQVINRGNNYNTSNGRFTAPVTGVYFFWHVASARYTSSGTYEVKLYINGASELARSFSNGAGYGHSAYASAYVQLSAGDFITAGFYNGASVVFSGQSDVGNSLAICSGWGGHLVG